MRREAVVGRGGRAGERGSLVRRGRRELRLIGNKGRFLWQGNDGRNRLGVEM